MANYYMPTVVQQSIPTGDMTPLERLVLSLVFDAEPDGERSTSSQNSDRAT